RPRGCRSGWAGAAAGWWGPHDRFAQVELVHTEGHALLGPQAGQDREVPLEEAPALLEVHAHGVELASVPAGGDAQDKPAMGDRIERGEGLGRDGRVPERKDEHPRPELDAVCARGDRREDADRVEE